MLVIGVALGSLAFPSTKTETTTRLQSVTTVAPTTTTVTKIMVSPTTLTPDETATEKWQIVQESLYLLRACTVTLEVTTFQMMFFPTILNTGNYVIVMVTTTISDYKTTTTISPPSIVTTVVNGTTFTQACG